MKVYCNPGDPCSLPGEVLRDDDPRLILTIKTEIKNALRHLDVFYPD